MVATTSVLVLWEHEATQASLKPCSPPKESSIGKQDTTASPQPSCASGGLSKAIGTQEQTFTQPSSPFRSFPIILTNPPVQRKSQLFWGLPSLHSDSLETTLLSSNDSYPLKLSVYPSVFFNKVALLPKYFLLLPHYGSQNTFPLYEARTTEDLEGAAPDSQLEKRPPEDACGYEPQWACRGNRRNPEVPESLSLDLNPELCESGPGLEATKKDTEYAKNSWASEPSSLALSPPPTRVLEPLRVTPKGVLSDAKARCRNIQIRGPSSPTNSVLKTHSNEPFRNQSKCKPAGDAVEQKNNCQASELPAPSSLSTLPQPHPDSEFVHKNLPQKQVPSPPVVDPLHPISCPPILAEAPKIEPTQPALQKGQLFTGARAEAPSSQSKADSGVLTHTGTHSWQWSRTLAHRLKKLQHSSPFRASHPGQQFCSSPVPSSRTPDSWGLSSGPSQKAHPPHPYPQSSSSHPPIVQSTVSEPVHTPHCHHSFSSSPPQPQVSGEAEQGSQNEKMKRKRVAHRESQRVSAKFWVPVDPCPPNAVGRKKANSSSTQYSSA
ncbi:spermatogenesis-associated protein 31G1 [Ctenodactylus gundi]